MKFLKKYKKILIGLVGILIVAGVAIVYPMIANAGWTFGFTRSECLDQSECKYSTTIYVNLTNNTTLNHVKFTLTFTEAELASLTPEGDFEIVSQTNNGDGTYDVELTSNTVYSASDGQINLLTVTYKSSGSNCELAFEPSDITTVTTNNFTIEKKAYATDKTTEITSVEIGEEFYYAIVVTGKSNAIATDEVIVTDTIPSNLTIVDDGGATSKVGTNGLTWNLGSFTAGTYSTTIWVLVKATASGTYNNEACMTVGGDNEECDDVPINVVYSDISITKSASVTQSTRGGSYYYTITVTNSGTGTSGKLVVTDTLDSDLTFVSSDTTYTVSGSTYTFDIGTLDAGKSKTIKIYVSVSDSTTKTIIENTAIVTEDGDNPLEDDADVDIYYPILSVEKNASVYEVKQGDTFTYTITYKNTGTGSATNVKFSDTINDNLEIVSVSDSNYTVNGQSITRTISSMSAGSSYTVVITVKAKSDATLGEVPNIVYISSDNYDTITDEDDVLIKGSNISITKTASASIVEPNDSYTYTITVTNAAGTYMTDTNEITVTDTLEDYLTLVDGDGATVSGQKLTWTISSLAPGESKSYTITVKVNDGVEHNTTINNVAIATEDGKDPVEDDVDVLVVDEGIAFTKTVDGSTYQSGDTVTYVITIYNGSIHDVDNVDLTDYISEVTDGHTYLTYASGTTTKGTLTEDDGEISVAIDTIEASETVTITLKYTVDSDAPDGSTITNNAVLCYGGDNTNYDACETKTVDIEIIDTDVSVTKSASVTTIQNDTEYYYTITVTNSGKATAKNLTVEDTLDDYITVVDADGGIVDDRTITWTIDSLAYNESVTYTIKVKVTGATDTQEVINKVLVTEPGKTKIIYAEVTVTVVAESTPNPSTGSNLPMLLITAGVAIGATLIYLTSKRNKFKKI